MNEFDGIKVGEIYTWKNRLMNNADTCWMCINIGEARPYGKTGKMFSNITYMYPGFRTYKIRHISGSDMGWIALNEML